MINNYLPLKKQLNKSTTSGKVRQWDMPTNILKHIAYLLIITASINYTFAIPGTVQITTEINNIRGRTPTIYDINEDIFNGGIGVMPYSVGLNCNTQTGMLFGSNVKCSGSMWFDLESAVYNTTASTCIGNKRFTLAPFRETRRGHCAPTHEYRLGESFQLPCTWSGGDIDINLQLTPEDSRVTIEQQTLRLHITSPLTSSNPSAQDMNVSGTFIYQTNDYLLDWDDYNASDDITFSSVDFWYGGELTIIGSNFGTTLTSATGLGNLHGESDKVTASLDPAPLEVSFERSGITKEKTKQIDYASPATNQKLADLYLMYNGNNCGDWDDSNICYSIISGSAISIICDSPDITVRAEKTGHPNPVDAMATILGTWGNRSVNTTCAITVILPYE